MHVIHSMSRQRVRALAYDRGVTKHYAHACDVSFGPIVLLQAPFCRYGGSSASRSANSWHCCGAHELGHGCFAGLCVRCCAWKRHHHGRGLHHRHGARLPLSMLHQSRRQRSRLLPRRRRLSRHLPPVCSEISHRHDLLHQLPRSWSHDLLLHRHLPLLLLRIR